MKFWVSIVKLGTWERVRFRLKVGQAKADVTRAGGIGSILCGDTDDLVKLGATEQEQFEHFESRMIANAQSAAVAASSAPPPRQPRKRRSKV